MRMVLILMMTAGGALVEASGLPLGRGCRVLYVPGWLRNGSDHTDNLDSLRKLYPESELVVHRWDGDRLSFEKSRDHADAEGRRLGAELASCAASERARTVLVGHSLGGRVVVRALAELARRGMKVRRGIVLGAALPCDDAELPWAVLGSSQPVVCVACQHDPTLKLMYGLAGGEGSVALGVNGWPAGDRHVVRLFMPPEVPSRVIPKNYKILRMEKMRQLCTHLAKFYFEYLVECAEADFKTQASEVVVPQDCPNLETGTLDWGMWWRTRDACAGWKLQEHRITGHFRILDERGVRRAWGSPAKMREAFREVRRQVE